MASVEQQAKCSSTTTQQPFDTSSRSGATGVFDFYEQANIWPSAKYATGTSSVRAGQLEGHNLTLDYGLRFYWMQPQYDRAGLTSGFTAGYQRAVPSVVSARHERRPGARGGGSVTVERCWRGSSAASSYSGDIANGLRTGGTDWQIPHQESNHYARPDRLT